MRRPNGTYARIHGALRRDFNNVHESLDVSVFALVLVRLVKRWRNPPPPLPAPIGKNEELAKTAVPAGAIAIGLLIAGHLLGVINHTGFRRDGLLRRVP